MTISAPARTPPLSSETQRLADDDLVCATPYGAASRLVGTMNLCSFVVRCVGWTDRATRRCIPQRIRVWPSRGCADAQVRCGRAELAGECAAAADPEIAALQCARASQRLSNYRQAATLLAERGALRSGVTIDQAAASIFATGHPETYRALVLDGDWSDDDWAGWLQATLESTLLKP